MRPAQDTAEYTRERLLLIAKVGFCACRAATADDGRAPAAQGRAGAEAVGVKVAEAPAAESRSGELKVGELRIGEPKAGPRVAETQPVGSRVAG
ncbi:hypothetical protein [Planomonospora venezuelensis]|uniref:Uncharacterized protein n=1 Tax=Planomonospora venezuelensis TaxID=1999 RepID=A0A841CWH3_PLAVE|nr:hypothetical protein [Planomonospora venezuelensis]MBB5961659.1 hypothetical protein [Planomonospora venezuelensis]